MTCPAYEIKNQDVLFVCVLLKYLNYRGTS